MKKFLTQSFVLGSLFVAPLITLAHGGTEDGHIEAVPAADPSSRIYVMIGVGVVFAIMLGWFIWSKMKSSK